MKKPKVRASLITSLTIFYMPFSLGQSVVDGTYLSEGDAAGNGKCTLSINLIAQPHEYGDEVFSLESSGDGSCEWSAIGISKNYTITAGMINNAGIITFLKLTFPFGPAGNRIEATSFDLDGSDRNKENFNKLD
jgi:hypothetical protein